MQSSDNSSSGGTTVEHDSHGVSHSAERASTPIQTDFGGEWTGFGHILHEEVGSRFGR
jgi:hypothetical protein